MGEARLKRRRRGEETLVLQWNVAVEELGMLLNLMYCHKIRVALDKVEEVLILGVLFEAVTERLADHRVLAHEQLALAAEVAANLLHLVRADVVDGHDHDLRVCGVCVCACVCVRVCVCPCVCVCVYVCVCV